MDDILSTILAIAIALAIIGVVMYFLITQQNTLKAIQQQNRLMRPGEVWLQLIPLFGIVWQFIVVTRISDSIRREFVSRQNDSILGYADAQAVAISSERPTYSIGIAMCTLRCCIIVPILGSLALIAALVCLVVYWKKLSDYKRLIETGTI